MALSGEHKYFYVQSPRKAFGLRGSFSSRLHPPTTISPTVSPAFSQRTNERQGHPESDTPYAVYSNEDSAFIADHTLNTLLVGSLVPPQS